jgi:hypothetical protein
MIPIPGRAVIHPARLLGGLNVAGALGGWMMNTDPLIR